MTTHSHGCLGLILALVFLTTGVLSTSATPLEFRFTPPKLETVKNPFARELWAEVITPSGRKLLLPAFYYGNGVFAVRARPEEIGEYQLGGVTDTTGGTKVEGLAVSPVGEIKINNRAKARLPAIGRDPKTPRAFLRGDGRPFLPVGANVAWPDGDCLPFYRKAIDAFAANNLNWMRVWMVHWGHLNLDWVPEWLGQNPPPGGIDPKVADNWDQLLATAEEKGVYIQMVFQHHGQLTTGENSNWADNPWNVARGGFLKTPDDFFTDPNARLLTVLKYRYIVARWGWSPAVMAWELFNEVHWVDAIDKHHNEAAVARWHSDMATAIRSFDAYAHMITTSTENLGSPIYEKMDFYQPHLYAANLITGARTFAPLPGGAASDRPVFYGEFGDDHVSAAPELKQTAITLVPPMWASIMGQGVLPAQPWEGAKLLAQNRLGELGAVHRFLALSGFIKQHELSPFSVAVDCATRVPLVLEAGQTWQRRPAPEIDLPLDGREPLGLSEIPSIYIGWPNSVADGFPQRATYRFDLPRETTFRARMVEIGKANTAIRFVLDGNIVAEKTWPANAADAPKPDAPVELPFAVKAGQHTLVVENPGNSDWVNLSGIDLGLDAPVLAAIGQRNERFIALWVRHRTNLMLKEPGAPASGTLLIDEVPAGSWKVVWWDTAKGEAGKAEVVQHAGGTLRVATPAISRHAAVVLTRQL